jgi:hypothetical protein
MDRHQVAEFEHRQRNYPILNREKEKVLGQRTEWDLTHRTTSKNLAQSESQKRKEAGKLLSEVAILIS